MKRRKTTPNPQPAQAPADVPGVIRAVTLPVSAPIGRSWEELWAVLNNCWRMSTHAANWCVQQLYRRDTIGPAKTPDAVKMGRTDKGQFYAYGEAGKEPWFKDWAGAKQSLNICLRYAHRKYLQDRFDVVVRFKQNLLSVRYPYPFPIDADAWAAGYTAEQGKPSGAGFPTVTLTLPGGEKFTLRLARRADFGRQLAMFRMLQDGTAKHGEAALYRNGKGDLLLKLVGTFPRQERAAERVHACLLRTDPAALLVAEIDGRAPWVLNYDQTRRRQAAHRAYLQRVGEDAKREKRMHRDQRAQLNESRRLRCAKHADRIKTHIKQAAAQVVRFVQRQRVGVVVFDDHVRTFVKDGFQWAELAGQLRTQLDGIGVPVVEASTVAPEEMAAWLADRSLVRATALAGRRLVAGVRRTGPHPAVTTTGSTSRTRRKSSGSAR